ncbi:MAG: hypothetical protein QGG75_04780 [Alphaproteobacteria bacterium]|nr:hypothetical protein [Alphaproteobacteria bacterium]
MAKERRWGREGALLGLGLLLLPAGAGAGEPVAIVEDIQAAGSKVQFMDYLELGQVVELGAGGQLVLGYLRSCQQESISGGRVTVGREQSQVEGGQVARELVECDGGKPRLGSDTKGKSGVMVFRAPPKKSAAARHELKLTIYGASPIFVVGNGASGSLTVERLDRPGEPLELELEAGRVDLVEADEELAPGGIYRASGGKGTIVFRVDRYARPGAEPLLSRLVQF